MFALLVQITQRPLRDGWICVIRYGLEMEGAPLSALWSAICSYRKPDVEEHDTLAQLLRDLGSEVYCLEGERPVLLGLCLRSGGYHEQGSHRIGVVTPEEVLLRHPYWTAEDDCWVRRGAW